MRHGWQLARYERANSQRHVENLMRGTSASVYYSRQKGEDEIGGGATMPNNNNAIISCCGYGDLANTFSWFNPVGSCHPMPFPLCLYWAAVNCNNHKVSGRQRETEREASEMHKRDEIMVGKERRAKCRERVGVIVLCSLYRLREF